MALQYIGTITRTHGITGECVLGDTDKIPSVKKNTTAHIGYTAQFGKKYSIDYIKPYKNTAIIKFATVNDISTATTLKELGVFIEEDSIILSADDYFDSTMIGFTVQNGETGEVLGNIVDVWKLPAHSAYVIKTPNGNEVVMPAVGAFVSSVDTKQRLMIATPPDGMFNEVE